MVISPEG
jgi:hypothetical protein